MLRKVGSVGAMLLVLLPIGGLSYVARANPAPGGEVLDAPGMLATVGESPEFAALALVFVGIGGLVARRLLARARRRSLAA